MGRTKAVCEAGPLAENRDVCRSQALNAAQEAPAEKHLSVYAKGVSRGIPRRLATILHLTHSPSLEKTRPFLTWLPTLPPSGAASPGELLLRKPYAG